MKTSTSAIHRGIRVWLVCLVTGALLAVVTQAQMPILLTVNVSKPAAVVFTATGQTPATENTDTTVFDGVSLASFFTTEPADLGGDLVGPPTLAPHGAGAAYDYYLSSADELTGLNLFRWNDDSPQLFVSSAAAFTGSALADFSTVSTLLRSPGFTADVVVGYHVSGPVIGQYQIVVPEPPAAAWAFIAPLGALFLILRRRAAR